MTVRWTRRALRRVDEIGDYIANDNPRAAQKVVAAIFASVATLAHQPGLGRPGRLKGTRERLVAGTPYIVAYRVHQVDIEVLTVLHAAQAWPESL